MKHELKCEAEYFDAVKRGEKLFEIRKNDRGYAVGDTIVMRRTANGEPPPYDLDGVFHGPLELIVTYMTDYAQKPGYVVLGVQKAVPTSLVADNAALRAQVEEVEEQRDTYFDAASEIAKLADELESRATRAEELAESRSRELDDLNERLMQEETRREKAEAALSEQAMNIVTMTHLHDGLRRSNELLTKRAVKAEAELAVCAKDRGEWMEACLKAQAERYETHSTPRSD